MRRTSHGHGFWVSYLINMAFRIEWLAAAVLLFVLYHFFNLPVLKIPAFLSLAVWFIYPLILTIFLGWVRRVGSEPEPHKENKNPYSNGRKAEKEMIDKNMCPCCGKYRFEEPGEYEICQVCGWEDDPVQRKDPDFEGGANKLSLNQAKDEYKKNNK